MSESPFGYFERIFCINRDCRTQRWARAKEELGKLGITDRLERFSAIEDPEDPERGCMRSHKACAMTAYREGAKNVLVFEDDIKIYDTSDVAAAIEELKRTPWKMFYLGGYPSRRRTKTPTGAVRFSDHLCRLRGGYLCGHAYAVHCTLFEDYSRVTQPVDRWWAYTIQPQQLALVVKKLVVGQQNGFSDLRGKRRSRDFIRRWHNKMIRRALRS